MTFINVFREDGLKSLIICFDLQRMCFGLLTYIPLLVTEQATVYTVLKNIMIVLAQLNREILPVFSNDSVCKVVIDFVPQRSTEFSNSSVFITWISHG